MDTVTVSLNLTVAQANIVMDALSQYVEKSYEDRVDLDRLREAQRLELICTEAFQTILGG